ncbi:hypothetical protein Poli38472_014296 [Pythium oligandrum]|uniref:BZIP domain-containing protein n=1 Tax=Pythium oligandrum TaxID=41045 RepID=A0A8K1CIG7_PYTOL|nr:hypothetical protein Poli38472_014296 [Pythium oligandrum]|eukprot:TMW64179.1 hypothetical protein Poli38472_014296 [Pythium oligandrum]
MGVSEEGSPVSSTSSRAIVNRKKSNSERGREFRAKRKKYENILLEAVTSLRQEVEDLQFLRGIRQEIELKSRTSVDGSLARVAREYFSLFERGIPTAHVVGSKRGSSPNANDQIIAKQNEFVHRAMDNDLQFGDLVGVDKLIDQWQRYTAYHSSFQAVVLDLEITGPEDAPIVKIRVDLKVTFSRDTFENVFPHVANNEEFIQRHLGREVTYPGLNQFKFTDDGRINVYESDVAFVDALINSGMSLDDVSILMQQAMIADQHLLGENPEDAKPLTPQIEEIVDEDEDSQPESEPAKRSRRLDIDYLLS